MGRVALAIYTGQRSIFISLTYSPGVVLPLDCAEGIPIYVDAKQYLAILGRQQTRAKLNAQKKLAKSRMANVAFDPSFTTSNYKF